MIAKISSCLSLALCLLITISNAGCRTTSGQAPPAKTLIGYGLVNHWFEIDPAKLADALADRGLNTTEIEYVPWFDDLGRQGLSSRTDVEAARLFVKAMRRRSVSTLISVVNWNGEAQRAQDDAWYRTRICEIRDRVGTPNVLLLPISEPDDRDPKCMRWQQIAIEEWPGTLVANGPFGRGEALFAHAAYTDWHWCKDFTGENVRPQPFINNTDCRPVLNPGPERAAAMASAALNHAANFLVYDWDGEEIDEPVLDALSRQLWLQQGHP